MQRTEKGRSAWKVVFAVVCLVFLMGNMSVLASQSPMEQLAEETLILSEAGKTKTVVWWLIPEFWEALLVELTELDKADRDRVVDLVRPYNVIMVINQTGSFLGIPVYTTDSEIRKITRLIDVNGNSYMPIETNNLPKDLTELLDATKGEFVEMMGVVGAYAINMVCFPRTDTRGLDYADTRKPGRLTLAVNNIQYSFQLPLQSVLQQDGYQRSAPTTSSQLPEVKQPGTTAVQPSVPPTLPSRSPEASHGNPLVLDPNGLIAHYDLGSIQDPIKDLSGSDNHGSMINTTWEQGALRFHGNSVVTVPHSRSLNVTSGITIEVWVKFDNYSPFQAILTKSEGILASWGLQMSDEYPYNRVRYMGNFRRGQYVESVSSVPLNTWTHIAVTNDGHVVKIYIDGKLDNSQAAGIPVHMNTEALIIGCDYQGPNEYLTGSLQRVIIYNRALSNDDIASHYASVLRGATIDSARPSVPSAESSPTRAEHNPAGMGIFGQPPSRSSETAEQLIERGKDLNKEGEYNLALEVLNRAIAIDEYSGEAHKERGLAYISLEQWSAGLLDLQRAERLDSADHEIQYLLHFSHAALGDVERAMASINRALVLNPTESAYLSSRAALYKAMGQYELAVADYEQALSLSRDQDVSLYADLGNIYHEIGEYQRAIEQYNRGLQIDSREPALYYNRANSYAAVQRQDLAIGDFNNAILLDPEYTEAYFNRGNSFFSQGDIAMAIADYTRAIELDSINNQFYYNRGNAHYQLNSFSAAKADYDIAIQLASDVPEPYFNKAMACEALDLRREAIEAYDLFVYYASGRAEYAPYVDYARKRLAVLR